MVEPAFSIARPLARGIAHPLASHKGGGASSFASRPAPAGFQWDFVTAQGARVTAQGSPVVTLVRSA